MSDDPAVGVVGTDFRVHGTRNLFVCDASVFPTSIHINPQLDDHGDGAPRVGQRDRAGGMRTGRRRTWRNHTGNQRCQPIEVRRPATLGDIVEAVRDAEARRAHRARGRLRALLVGRRR